MKRFLHCYMLVSCLISICVPFSAHAQTASKDYAMRNAYEVSKALYKLSSQPPADSNKDNYTKVLAALSWYAGLETGAISVEKLLRETGSYTELKRHVENIINYTFPVENFFLADTDTVDTKLKSYQPLSDTRREKLKDFYKKYTDSTNCLSRIEDIIKSKQKCIRTLESEQRDINTTYSPVLFLGDICHNYPKELREESAGNNTSDSSSSATDTLRKKIACSCDSLQKRVVQRDSIRTAIERIKKETIDYISKNKDPQLAGFIKAISPSNTTTVSFTPFQVELNNFTTEYQTTAEAIIYTTELSGSSFRMPSQAEMIDALAIYLAKRVKQETVMWFFETITRQGKQFPLIEVFFPTTMKMLKTHEPYEIPNMGAQWQYALSKDFLNMPRNVLSSQWAEERWPEAAKYKPFMTGVSDMADLLMNRNSYREIIRTMYLSEEAAVDSLLRFRDLIGLLYAVNNELFVPDTAKYRLLKYEDYRSLNAKEIDILLSLLDLKYGKVIRKFIETGKDINGNFSIRPEHAEQIRRWLGQIETATSKIEHVRRDFLRKTEDNNWKDWSYSTYHVWGAFNELMTVFSPAVNQQYQTLFSGQLNASRRVFHHTGEVLEIYNLISRKNFAGAVNQTIQLMDALLYGAKQNDTFSFSLNKNDDNPILKKLIDHKILQKKATDTNSALVIQRTDTTSFYILYNDTSDYGFSIDANSNSINFPKSSPIAALVFEEDRHAIQIVRKLSGFLNDVALSKNDEQLSKVIESYAMPPGSYKRKRNNWHSWDINAFVGAYYAYEWTSQQNDNYDNGGIYGLSAPIGISYSKTFGTKIIRKKKRVVPEEDILNPNKLKIRDKELYQRTNWTLTTTLSLVDIGAMVSFRLSDSHTELNHDLKWQQFISPGFHVGLGIPRSPLLVQAGVQYTPLLRRLEDFSGIDNKTQLNTLRTYIGIFFDLPLLNLSEGKKISRK